MGRSLVFGGLAFAGMLMGATTAAQADHDRHCHPAHRYGYRGIGVGIGVYAPPPYYVAPPPVVYAPPPPVYYAPPAYPVYQPYPAAGLGISTKSFGLWLGR